MSNTYVNAILGCYITKAVGWTGQRTKVSNELLLISASSLCKQTCNKCSSETSRQQGRLIAHCRDNCCVIQKVSGSTQTVCDRLEQFLHCVLDRRQLVLGVCVEGNTLVTYNRQSLNTGVLQSRCACISSRFTQTISKIIIFRHQFNSEFLVT